MSIDKKFTYDAEKERRKADEFNRQLHGRTEPKPIAAPCLVPLKTALAYWNPPFRYESEGGIIVDRSGSRIIDIRGWGRLTGMGSGGLAMRDDKAAAIQDDIGRAVVDFLNANT